MVSSRLGSRIPKDCRGSSSRGQFKIVPLLLRGAPSSIGCIAVCFALSDSAAASCAPPQPKKKQSNGTRQEPLHGRTGNRGMGVPRGKRGTFGAHMPLGEAAARFAPDGPALALLLAHVLVRNGELRRTILEEHGDGSAPISPALATPGPSEGEQHLRCPVSEGVTAFAGPVGFGCLESPRWGTVAFFIGGDEARGTEVSDAGRNNGDDDRAGSFGCMYHGLSKSHLATKTES